MSLKLGLNTGYWASGPPSPAALAAVKEAERLGFDSIWASETYGSDALTPLAWWGSQTERVKLGTTIIQMSARRPTARRTFSTSQLFEEPSASFAVPVTI